jgi:hypothetical protein
MGASLFDFALEAKPSSTRRMCHRQIYYPNIDPVVDDPWYQTTGGLPQSLARRSTLEDVSAFAANKIFFTCNDNGQCSSGACAGQACDWNPAKSRSNN